MGLDLFPKNCTLPPAQMERLFATYLIETPLAVERAAAVLAGEQSSGTFVAMPGETEELKQRFAARVEKITPLETVTTPSLPGAKSVSGKFQRAEVVVSWSLKNMGYNLPTLVSTIQWKSLRAVAIHRLEADGCGLAAVVRQTFSRAEVWSRRHAVAHRSRSAGLRPGSNRWSSSFSLLPVRAAQQAKA